MRGYLCGFAAILAESSGFACASTGHAGFVSATYPHHREGLYVKPLRIVNPELSRALLFN